jgi:hypothetical protein
MYEALADKGIQIEGGSSGEFASDPIVAQEFINGYTESDALNYVKTEKCNAISAHAKSLRDKVVSTVSAGEMASWSIKAAEAAKFNASGDPSQCPMLSAEASARGISVAELVSKVNTNASRFIGCETAIGGTDGKHRDAVTAMVSIEDVIAYDYLTGWPEV